MALSEREQQLLEDMERHLYQSEADVVQAKSAGTRLNLRSLVLGILMFVCGLVALVVGAGLQLLWVGLLGFAAMLGGTLYAFTRREQAGGVAGSRPGGSTQKPPAGASSQRAARSSLTERMNQRWEERMDGDR